MKNNHQPEPDFQVLRALRNTHVREQMEKIAKEHGVPVESLETTFDFNSCYCACPTGPCEHKWDGPIEQGDLYMTSTCSRCGMSSMSHDMRVGP